MCGELSPWDEAVNFHGHSCPGLAIGYRVAQIALRELGVQRARDEELVAIVENDSCSVDAIQVLTGCSFGKGNLIYHPWAKQVYTIGNRRNKEALRIALKPMPAGAKDKLARLEEILAMPEQDFCALAKVELELPPRARLFKSLQCSECGEMMGEVKARVKNGQVVCIPCAEA
ncbi:MAG: FmdE family protein [Peptococcaceae bacterium]|nr:FmdE family protein [Peptococcaceae bacterium]